LLLRTPKNAGKDASDFFIKGITSDNSTEKPLIIVDDVVSSYADLQKMNVNEIESISVLKDESTTKFFGDKAKYGVLQVTTRKSKGKSDASPKSPSIKTQNLKVITPVPANK
ncbi:MAG: hypothetical protein EOP47_22585, partial [Sphingobacteriaceae bacterium]